MNIYTVLESLQKEVSDGKTLPWPLQEKTIIDRDRLLTMIEKTRRSLPDEIKQARWISKENERVAEETINHGERLMLEARLRYEEILQHAEQAAEKLVSKEEIHKRAQAEAKKLLDRAQKNALEIRQQAQAEAAKIIKSAQEQALRGQQEGEHYLKKLLATLENDLGKATAIVAKSRKNLTT